MTLKPTRINLNHSRRIAYDSFERSDGLFDIEGTLTDTKGYLYSDRERGLLQIGEPLHDIYACLTISSDYVVQEFVYEMRAVPFRYCQTAVDPAALRGASIWKGWRVALNTAFGPHRGCSHLRELVLGMGTVAFQTLSALNDEKRIQSGGTDADRTEMPFFLGGCHSWALDGPVVQTWFPQFATKPDDPDS